MPRPLAGLRVVDFTYVWAGPGTEMYLADQGAYVVKVEPPTGAPTLGTKTIEGRPVHPDGAPSGDYLVLNRGKRSVSRSFSVVF
jgi:crotonobetainyl-CoA:carnitine CoA-transferase CaiB-like acyl-CoA transferase